MVTPLLIDLPLQRPTTPQQDSKNAALGTTSPVNITHLGVCPGFEPLDRFKASQQKGSCTFRADSVLWMSSVQECGLSARYTYEVCLACPKRATNTVEESFGWCWRGAQDALI